VGKEKDGEKYWQKNEFSDDCRKVAQREKVGGKRLICAKRICGNFNVEPKLKLERFLDAICHAKIST